jgi:hypothetical protein
MTCVHDPLVDFQVGLGGELLVAVDALEPLLAVVDRLHVVGQLRPETHSTKNFKLLKKHYGLTKQRRCIIAGNISRGSTQKTFLTSLQKNIAS